MARRSGRAPNSRLVPFSIRNSLASSVMTSFDARDYEVALAEWEARRAFRDAAKRAEEGYAAGEEEPPHDYVVARLLAELDQSEAEADDAFGAYWESMEKR
jgi:hypothetical protein